MKCKQPHLGFEVKVTIPFSMMMNVTHILKTQFLFMVSLRVIRWFLGSVNLLSKDHIFLGYTEPVSKTYSWFKLEIFLSPRLIVWSKLKNHFCLTIFPRQIHASLKGLGGTWNANSLVQVLVWFLCLMAYQLAWVINAKAIFLEEQ